MNLLLLFLLFCVGDALLIVGLQLLILYKIDTLKNCLKKLSMPSEDVYKRKVIKPFKHFSPAQRELAILKSDSGMRVKDIATSMNLVPQQIYGILYQAKKRKDKQ